jgi:hypothetical protein
MQIAFPVPSGPIGPGMFVHATTSFIGPLETDSIWEAHLLPATGERDLATARMFSNFSTVEMVLGEFSSTPSSVGLTIQPQESFAPHGAAARLQVTLSSPLGQVIDTTTIPVTIDALTGLQWVSSQGTAPAGGGGFTSSDRTNLDLVLAAVRAVMPAALTGGPNIVMQAIDLVRGPPRSLLRRFGSVTLTGRGTISAQPPGAAHSFGGTWSFVTVPAGYGRDDGALVEYHRRFAQFVVVRDEVTSDTYIDVLEDSHYEGNFILWQFPNPLQIQYDIAPGVVVLWQWLV